MTCSPPFLLIKVLDLRRTQPMTRILIIGAGIGGLTLAHACLQNGFEVTLFEKAVSLEPVGAGIQISPNAVKVLKGLDLFDYVSENAFYPEAIETRLGRSGRQIFSIDLKGKSQRRWGAPYLHIHRADYISALSGALPQGVLKLGTDVKHIDQTDTHARVELSSGETIEGDILIGADGIHSVVRDYICGEVAADFTGNIAWRSIVPLEALGGNIPPPTACAWFGPGRHAVTYRLGAEGQFANFVGVVETDDWLEEGWSIEGQKGEALEDFDGWDPVITQLIETSDKLYKWALFDRPPLSKWHKGRVALLGDAAHPMLPFLAQGAAMAVEDGWVLSQALKSYPIEKALTLYHMARLPRTTKVQAASRANMKTFHISGPLSQLSTYGPMWIGGRVLPSVIGSRFDWIYGYNALSV